MDKDRDRQARSLRLIGTLTMVPFLLAAGPLVGFFMGSLLDRWFGTDPWLRWIFLALGFGAGVKEVARLLRRAARDMDRL